MIGWACGRRESENIGAGKSYSGEGCVHLMTVTQVQTLLYPLAYINKFFKKFKGYLLEIHRSIFPPTVLGMESRVSHMQDMCFNTEPHS